MVLDALNIVRSYKEFEECPEGTEARKALDLEALWRCCEFFQRHGVPFKAFAPRGFIEVREGIAPRRVISTPSQLPTRPLLQPAP